MLYNGRMSVPKRLPRFRRGKTRPFQFQERDYEIVRSIGLLRVAQSAHIDRLFPGASPDNLRRRLYYLFHNGYLVRPKAQAGELVYHEGSSRMVYTLAPKGAQLLMEREGLQVAAKAADSELPHLKHALLVTDFMVAMHEACAASEHLRLVSQSEILAGAPAATQGERRPSVWRVEIDYRGVRKALHLEPDGIFAIAHAELAPPQDRKFFFLEIDRGTMPIVRGRVDQTSILRKLLAYGATYRAGIHRERFGLDNMRVLMVGKTGERVRGMIDAFQEHLSGKVSPRLFLAADRRALFGNPASLLAARWQDMAGEERSLFE